MSHSYVIFSARFAPEVGGVETFTDNLSKALIRRGNKVTLVTSAISSPAGWEHREGGISILRLPCWSLLAGRLPLLKKGSQFNQLFDELCEQKTDRVLVNTRFYGLSILGLQYARKKGAPAVVLDHGSTYLTLGNRAIDALIKLYEHWITFRGKGFYPKYAGISAASAHWLKTFGIETELVIPNAIDAQAFREIASDADYRRFLKEDPNRYLVVSIGRLTSEKGSDVLVEAARLLGKKVHIAIAGEGPLRTELERALPSNVSLLGNLSHPNLSALLRDADLFCLPTRSEGFCTSLLESGAWGLVPCITKVGGSDEVMGNPTRFGWILEDMNPQTVAHTIDRALESGVVGHSIELQNHVEKNCSWEATVNALEEAFR